MSIISFRCLRKRVEALLECHDSARKALELAFTRPCPQHVPALVYSHCLPRPLGYQDGVKARLHALVEAPPRPLTLLIQSPPHMTERRAHGVFHNQLINDFALHVDFGKLTVLFGPQLIERQKAFHSFHGSLHVPATAIECESRFATEDLGCYRGKDENKLTEKQGLRGEFALLFLLLPRDLLACCLGFLLLHAIDLEGAVQGSLVFGGARVGLGAHDGSTLKRTGRLGLEEGPEIQGALGGMWLRQGPLMMPTDEDSGGVLLHGGQPPCIGAIPLIADHHIPGVQTIRLQALPALRLGNLDVMPAQGDQVQPKVQTISAAGCAGALHRGAITREESQVRGQRRQCVQGEHLFDQRLEQRRTAL